MGGGRCLPACLPARPDPTASPDSIVCRGAPLGNTTPDILLLELVGDGAAECMVLSLRFIIRGCSGESCLSGVVGDGVAGFSGGSIDEEDSSTSFGGGTSTTRTVVSSCSPRFPIAARMISRAASSASVASKASSAAS